MIESNRRPIPCRTPSAVRPRSRRGPDRWHDSKRSPMRLSGCSLDWRNPRVSNEPPTDARRVRDRITGAMGTVVAGPFRRDQRSGDPTWQVAWDNPTPFQDTARPDIPGQFYEWADDAHPSAS